MIDKKWKDLVETFPSLEETIVKFESMGVSHITHTLVSTPHDMPVLESTPYGLCRTRTSSSRISLKEFRSILKKNKC